MKMSTKHYEELRKKMRPEARAAAEKLARQFLAEIRLKEPCPWRDVIKELRPGEPVSAGALRGARGLAELTQVGLSEMTGISQRHISEMERGKRPIGKESARKLAAALNTDYRVFL